MERVDLVDFLRRARLTQSKKDFPRIVIVLGSGTRIKLTGVEVSDLRVNVRYVRAGNIGGWNTQIQSWSVPRGYYLKGIHRVKHPAHYAIISLESSEYA